MAPRKKELDPVLKKALLSEIKASARGFPSMAAWRSSEKRHENLYRTAKKWGFLFEAKKFFKMAQRSKGYWTRERCAAAARECLTRTEFKRRFPSAYDRALSHGWFSEIAPHMPENAKVVWTTEKIEEERKKHRTPSIWRILSPGSFRAAKKAKERKNLEEF